ncbi:chromosome segregation protein SMC [[Brevibacterium] frigoritolerans]|nr:chromosome segregation protein SMC [Peribacillus frigoritolerans]
MEIDFSGGVTGVVGPNGSGKSNIFDGIRWVLGETSAKSLRGGSMKDVIFSGCETRKSSTQAEVSLTIDNRKRILPKMDEDTVIITRTAHISGKSSYYINREPARLKDIQDLFLDTGLGSSSYSMIGQEQTKRLLSEKVDERRAIFEEAAGIVKMKNQKESTEKRLDEVEQDFSRLNDIMKELERQVKPLQKQSEKAKQFLGIKRVLDATETEFLSFKYQRLHKEEQSLSDLLSTKTSKLNESSLNVNELEERFKVLKENLKLMNESIFSIQEEKSKTKEQLDSYQNQIKINEERTEQANKDINEVNVEIKEIEQKFSVSVEEFNFKKNRYQELENLISNTKQIKDELGKELFHLQMELTSSKEKVETLREEITSLYNEYQEAKIRFEQHNRDEEKILNDLDVLKEKKKTHQVDATGIETSLNIAQNRFQENSRQIQEMNTKFQFIMNELSVKQKELGESSASTLKMQTVLVKDQTTLESLESSLENFEGYFEGVKNVLKNKHRLSGVLDVVSNLFNVKNGYEISLDSLLNAISQNIVVDSIQDAKNAVKFLKENKYGRATFIPLDDVSNRTLTKEELNQIAKFEGISPALSIIEFNKELEPLFQHLLGRNLVAQNMDVAVAFYEKTRIKTKIATLDGDILQPGTISGGTRNKKGLISKRKEMDILRENIKENKHKLLLSQEKETKLKQSISRLTEQKEEVISMIEAEREIINEIKLELESSQRELERVKMTEKEQDVTEKDLRYRFDESKKISSSLFTKHREKENLHRKKNDELTQLLQTIKAKEEQFELQKQFETNSIIDIEKFEEEKRNLTEFISEQENGKDSFEKRLEFLQAKRYSSESTVEKSLEEIDSLNMDLQSLTRQYTEIQQNLENQQDIKLQTQSEMDEVDITLSSLRTTLSQLTEEVHELNLDNTNALNDMQQLAKRGQDAYQLSPEQLLEMKVPPINEDATEKEIKSLIKELKQIGSVNLDSINDFEELNSRYQREKTQLEDIREAKNDLEKLLKDVSKEMTDRFIGIFKEVAKHFEKIFVELFGGGEAKLSLEDPRKPLTSHILITAKPPGKKPKKIELLSGGEKNLTVCALVFAIIKAKPSPFVYLDEIDAPLDDANVSRFAFYLKKFSEETQFIVVTHRKGTMMAADSLFGVTQEEQGITTVFPYHLEHSGYTDDIEGSEGDAS